MWGALTEAFRDVFDDDQLEIVPETRAEDIDEWDSLTNIQLLVAIEQKLGIRFTSSEVGDLRNVGELVEVIRKHL